jgi:hypothetical protein
MFLFCDAIDTFVQRDSAAYFLAAEYKIWDWESELRPCRRRHFFGTPNFRLGIGGLSETG